MGDLLNVFPLQKSTLRWPSQSSKITYAYNTSDLLFNIHLLIIIILCTRSPQFNTFYIISGSSVATIFGPPANNLFGPLAKG